METNKLNNFSEITMNDNDVIVLSSSKIKNKVKVECIKGVLFIDEISKKEINNLKEKKDYKNYKGLFK